MASTTFTQPLGRTPVGTIAQITAPLPKQTVANVMAISRGLDRRKTSDTASVCGQIMGQTHSLACLNHLTCATVPVSGAIMCCPSGLNPLNCEFVANQIGHDGCTPYGEATTVATTHFPIPTKIHGHSTTSTLSTTETINSGICQASLPKCGYLSFKGLDGSAGHLSFICAQTSFNVTIEPRTDLPTATYPNRLDPTTSTSQIPATTPPSVTQLSLVNAHSHTAIKANSGDSMRLNFSIHMFLFWLIIMTPVELFLHI